MECFLRKFDTTHSLRTGTHTCVRKGRKGRGGEDVECFLRKFDTTHSLRTGTHTCVRKGRKGRGGEGRGGEGRMWGVSLESLTLRIVIMTSFKHALSKEFELPDLTLVLLRNFCYCLCLFIHIILTYLYIYCVVFLSLYRVQD